MDRFAAFLESCGYEADREANQHRALRCGEEATYFSVGGDCPALAMPPAWQAAPDCPCLAKGSTCPGPGGTGARGSASRGCGGEAAWCETETAEKMGSCGRPRVSSVLGPVVEEADVLEDTFFVILRRKEGDAPLGLHLDLAQGAPVYICGLLPGGAAAEYNAGAKEDLCIKTGDYLVGVSGIRGNTPQLQNRLRERSIELEVARPVEWTVMLPRTNGEPMGLELNYAMEGRSLVIAGVSEGAVANWNRENPGSAIRRQDRIVSVGELEDASPLALLEMIGRCPGGVLLGLSRPPSLPDVEGT